MAATPLPASGAAPQAKTCDASGMAMIHRMFRSGFAEAPALVRGVETGDYEHAGAVAEHLVLLSKALHTHHEGEDSYLWPVLEERAPGCVAHVARMKQQHAVMLTALDELDGAVPKWRSSAGDGAQTTVLAALDHVNAALAVHLPDEEAHIVPVMETTITQKEVASFSRHGRAATPRGRLWHSLGLILSAQPDGGQRFLREDLPAPVRLLWRWVGSRRYAAYRETLERR